MVLLTRQDDGLITEANQYFESLFGWPVQDAIGRTTLELGLWVHPEQRAQLVKATKAKGELISMEVQFRASNGQVHDGILSAQKVELEGQPYLLSTFLDTTERKVGRTRPQGQPGAPRPGPGLGATGHLGLAHSQRHAVWLGARRPVARHGGRSIP